MMRPLHHVSHPFSVGPAYAQALMSSVSWTGTTGTSANVGYSFALSAEGGTLLNSAGRAAALASMQAWADVANITFSEVSGAQADLTFSQAALGSNVIGLATMFSSGTTISSAEVQLDSSFSSFLPGSIAYLTFLHEVGHAIGLKHPGNYSGSEEAPFLSSAEDSYHASVMSYVPGALASDENPPVTPMIYDIAAAQLFYGANTSYNAGATTYSFDGSATAQTIWDGGGTDALSAASYEGGGVVLDLREGLENLSAIGGAYVWVAFDADIENAEGSGSGDILRGNDLANVMTGRGGSDLLRGIAGNDTLYGGTGAIDPADAADTIYGGAGSDSILGNGGADALYGGIGAADPSDSADTIYGGGGNDAVYGNGAGDFLAGGGSNVDPNDVADTVYGGGGSDTILGNGGGDFLFGGGASADPNDSADTILGGAGNDSILGNGGADVIFGQAGDNTMHGGGGNDTYAFQSGGGVDMILLFENPGSSAGDLIQVEAGINGLALASAADALARVSYSGGDAILDLGGGASVTIVGVADGSLTASDFTLG